MLVYFWVLLLETNTKIYKVLYKKYTCAVVSFFFSVSPSPNALEGWERQRRFHSPHRTLGCQQWSSCQRDCSFCAFWNFAAAAGRNVRRKQGQIGQDAKLPSVAMKYFLDEAKKWIGSCSCSSFEVFFGLCWCTSLPHACFEGEFCYWLCWASGQMRNENLRLSIPKAHLQILGMAACYSLFRSSRCAGKPTHTTNHGESSDSLQAVVILQRW